MTIFKQIFSRNSKLLLNCKYKIFHSLLMTPMLIFYTIANQIVAYRSIFINLFTIERCFFLQKNDTKREYWRCLCDTIVRKFLWYLNYISWIRIFFSRRTFTTNVYIEIFVSFHQYFSILNVSFTYFQFGLV